MTSLNQMLKNGMIGAALSLLVVGGGTAWSAELYSLPTEEGLELFLLDNHIQAPALDVHAGVRSSVTVGEDGALTFSKPDSLAKHFGLNNAATSNREAVGYQGFRTSPLGRVLSIQGQFQPDLGPATLETADNGQSMERRFDFGKPQAERGGWENGQGLRILSF